MAPQSKTSLKSSGRVVTGAKADNRAIVTPTVLHHQTVYTAWRYANGVVGKQVRIGQSPTREGILAHLSKRGYVLHKEFVNGAYVTY